MTDGDQIKAAILKARENAQREPYDSYGIPISLAGHECIRFLWYVARWVLTAQRHEGRQLRLFETGEIEEERLLGELAEVCERVWTHDDSGKQYKAVMADGFLRGKLDGVARGAPGQADDLVLGVEAKSHNRKSFNHLVKHGVKTSKPLHYCQLQLYLHFFEFKAGIYTAVCKDDDDTHIEVTPYDPGYCEIILRNVERAVHCEAIPPRISNDPDFFGCRFCDMRELCHGLTMPKRRTCRTCIHSTFMRGQKRPTVECAKHGVPCDIDAQRRGCHDHRFLPQLVPMEQIDALQDEDGFVSVTYFDGKESWTDIGQPVDTSK